MFLKIELFFQNACKTKMLLIIIVELAIVFAALGVNVMHLITERSPFTESKIWTPTFALKT